ncbi:family 43 glycosylhydrolase [Streptomyces longwoodensis]|uniref:family 43 glycosylhydrolase n=1 Tax=Streptomyces longwoodensis TaxID=68231 RepID=UPI003400A9D0
MRRARRTLAWALGLLLAFAVVPAALHPTAARADNPVVQHVYTADPAPLVYDGRVYLYTGHDEDGSTYFTMKDWRVWSSADMVNWTDHGSPLSLATFSWASADAWAGQAVQRGGRFYWYVPVQRWWCVWEGSCKRVSFEFGEDPVGDQKGRVGCA